MTGEEVSGKRSEEEDVKIHNSMDSESEPEKRRERWGKRTARDRELRFVVKIRLLWVYI